MTFSEKAGPEGVGTKDNLPQNVRVMAALKSMLLLGQHLTLNSMLQSFHARAAVLLVLLSSGLAYGRSRSFALLSSASIPSPPQKELKTSFGF